MIEDNQPPLIQDNRPPLIVGNWKMYKTIDETVKFIRDLIPLVKECLSGIFLAVPFTAIKNASEQAKNSNIIIGAQNMNDATEGAFTGEIAGKMLKEAGAQFVIIGHSERRQSFQESNEFINRKVKRALNDGLRPILCIGETRQQRESDQTQVILKTQLTESLHEIPLEQLAQIVIAYEPIWAIGTGLTATPEQAQAMHHFCRETIAELWDSDVAKKVFLLYGGSVKENNAKELLNQADVDGFLIGGASLSLESFSQIINDCQHKIAKEA
jgi:triosephosphate isomerase